MRIQWYGGGLEGRNLTQFVENDKIKNKFLIIKIIIIIFFKDLKKNNFFNNKKNNNGDKN